MRENGHLLEAVFVKPGSDAATSATCRGRGPEAQPRRPRAGVPVSPTAFSATAGSRPMTGGDTARTAVSECGA